MPSETITFNNKKVLYLHGSSIDDLPLYAPSGASILLLDDQVAAKKHTALHHYRTIEINSGEASKSITYVEKVMKQLIAYKADKKTILVGIGGGLVTDITGFVASTYMRGIPFGFVPSTLLGMVDAAIGGKNGVNVGLHKNMIGTIKQPDFILYDTQLLNTLPDAEWSNGFAEVIKYACLFDKELFEVLSKHNISYYQQEPIALQELIHKCVAYKKNVVLADEYELNERKLLNFGHTTGHAIETRYELPHGYAVGIGMIIASILSTEITGLQADVTMQLKQLLVQYGLLTQQQIDTNAVMQVLEMDKKRAEGGIDFILLERLGKGIIKRLTFDTVKNAVEKYAHESNS